MNRVLDGVETFQNIAQFRAAVVALTAVLISINIKEIPWVQAA